MKKVLNGVVVVLMAAGSLVLGQGSDVSKILEAARQALGGAKLAAVKSFTATGHTLRSSGDTSTSNDFEMALELPDKFAKKEVILNMGSVSISRTSGFNGPSVINLIDQPPAMGGGQMIVRMGGPGQTPGAPGAKLTPEQDKANQERMLVANKQEFTRMSIGMFADSLAAFPVSFASAGVAESPDGKADVVEVKGEGDFTAKLFIDSKTHLPLMLSWMAREPLVMNNVARGGGPGNAAMAGMQFVTGGGGGRSMSQEDRDKMMADLEAQRAEAESKLRIVEYRLYYGDYKDVDGVKVPTRLSRSIDGKASDEIQLEKVRINPKIDAKKFEVIK